MIEAIPSTRAGGGEREVRAVAFFSSKRGVALSEPFSGSLEPGFAAIGGQSWGNVYNRLRV